MRKYPLQVEWDLDPRSENIEVTPSTLAQSMFFYIQAAGHFYAKKEYYTRRALYHSFLLLYTAGGQGRLRLQGRTYKLTPGTLCFIDCKEPHYYETDGGPGDLWEMYWVHFDGGSSQSYYEQIRRYAGPVLDLPAASPVPALLEQILQAHRQRSMHTDILSSKWVVDILTELLLHSIRRHPDDEPAHLPPHILAMMNEMERSRSGRITLDDLAKHHNFSKYHLAREFKRYTGYSPNEYLTHLRLSHAKDMLKHSALSIGEIAEQAGYNQTSFFIKRFKEREGLTPLEYRRRWRLPPEE
ncbi:MULTISPECIES: helix-turn-helix transcriptional regulator [Paenibacillus]|uniref:helix-turn-helix transcriptional regulator n=1 Tax=Paenibacillus TaxID=44249 RepID=UPI0022B8FAC9|nr:AraC family transcriptional regulator [Paenibacillus caseinilyticus]MCZ8519787.1 AraC family transcriptional regulator [Paenibacillus caseinilyticus]